jgi:hypothetical protein
MVYILFVEELRKEEEGIMREDRALKKIEREREKVARKIFWDKQRHIRNSIVYAAEERGRREGFISGCMAMQEDIACKMIARGYNSEEIQAITCLSSEEIKKLKVSGLSL